MPWRQVKDVGNSADNRFADLRVQCVRCAAMGPWLDMWIDTDDLAFAYVCPACRSDAVAAEGE